MTSEVRVIKSKSVTTASTDNNAKRSVQQKCEEVDEQAVIKSSEQRRSEQKVNRSQSFHAHFDTKKWSLKSI